MMGGFVMIDPTWVGGIDLGPESVLFLTISGLMADQVLEGSQPVDLKKHPSGIVPTLQNVVSTVNLDTKLDLKAIALKARNAEYNPKASFISFRCRHYEDQYEPELFPGLIYRMKQPKIVLLIFVSGKIVLIGAKIFVKSRSSFHMVLLSVTKVKWFYFQLLSVFILFEWRLNICSCITVL
ncbi:unnamed protein product [Trifolium pratense]|uniref:Uncharacterized protein n=1 Tax=Trifolium pratense TaxID=57577 RepID=A0ACB0JWV8_TRIPR|nr:unnamed protein product [Trifolium pratense]